MRLVFVSKVKLATIVEGNPKAPFSIATTPMCRGGRYSFPGLLYFTLDPYLIMLSVKQGGIKYHFLSLWYDSTWDWTQVSRPIGGAYPLPWCSRCILQSPPPASQLGWDGFVSYPGHLFGGNLTPLQRCSQCILQSLSRLGHVRHEYFEPYNLAQTNYYHHWIGKATRSHIIV